MKKRLSAFVLIITLGLSGCGSPEIAEAVVTSATTAAAFTMTTAAETTTTTPTIRETIAFVTKKENTSFINRLFNALLNKSEYIAGTFLNEETYNYLIENIDIDDYEILEEDLTAPFYEGIYKIRVSAVIVSLSELPPPTGAAVVPVFVT
jgi:ABC-type Fe3+-hydroxamate transport system substrate-binding protein